MNDREQRPRAADPRPLDSARLRVTPSGFALACVRNEDVFVPANALGAALDGDLVELETVGKSEKGPRGRVIRVLSRAARRLVGSLEEEGDTTVFRADDVRVHRSLRCAADETRTADHHVLYGADLVEAGDLVEVRLVRRFGPRGSARAEEDALLWREGLDEPFAPAVLADADRRARDVYASPLVDRKDLRALHFVTIDPATAEDHDDALYAERDPNGGFKVYVAIADVSAFVPEGSALDAEARRRGSSLYFPGRVIPMLPPILSADAASLSANVDRAAIVLELVLNADGAVVRHDVTRALVRSRTGLTYDEAAAILRGAGSTASPEDADLVRLFDEIAQRLRAGRRARGALAIESTEVNIECDPTTHAPTRISRSQSDADVDRAHQLVEEMMLLANETIAGMLLNAGGDAVYRVHDTPAPERLAQVIDLARRRGVPIGEGPPLDAPSLRHVIDGVSDPRIRTELMAALVDSMPAAQYAAGRKDHFALASKHYAHFTSPIRRYADLVIHRAICALASGAAKALVDVDAVNAASQRSRAIQREVTSLYGALLTQSLIGREISGTVVHVTARACIVALDEPAVSVRCATTPRTAKQQGQRVVVRVDDVSVARRAIEGSFVTEPARVQPAATG